MGRLRTLAILVSLGAGCRAALGSAPVETGPPAKAEAPAEAAAKPAAPDSRPEPPVAPRKYLEAGAQLFNKARYDLAAKYLEAAHVYRDRLTVQQQIVLDEYREQLDRYVRDQKLAKTEPAPAPAAAPGSESRPTDPGVLPASTVGAPSLDMTGDRAVKDPQGPAPAAPLAADPAAFPEPGVAPPAPEDPATRQPPRISAETLRGTADLKQKARWLLHQAREQLNRNQFEAAEKIVTEVRGMDIKWSYFDDTPDKVTESISKARVKAAKEGSAVAASDTSANLPRDRRTAKIRLREARAALAANDADKAEAIASEVRSWGLRFGLFDDTPDKVSAATGEARRRAAVRNAELMVRSYVGTDTASRGEPAVPVPPDPIPQAPR